MPLHRSLVPVFAGALALSCGSTDPDPDPMPGDENAIYTDVTDVNLPTGVLGGLSMDARPADIDGDGDLDIVVANEFGPNILLLNRGDGTFADGSARLPSTIHDSEDVGIADFDGDMDLDIVIVSEDDQVNELYLNDGNGFFIDASDRIPVRGITNALIVADFDGDDEPDLLLGNNGQNRLLIADGNGGFTDETATRLPVRGDVTQDVELGDVDGDGDRDILVGNEDDNRLLINDGFGVFTDESDTRLEYRGSAEETREADFGDVDGDRDLDVLFANVASSIAGAPRQNRLLINDGNGFFSDETTSRLPADQDRSFDGDFIDLDDDGDLDIITSNFNSGGAATRYKVFVNDGTGQFTLAIDILPSSASGFGFDVEPGDFNDDGVLDLYLASRGSADRLLLGVPPGGQ